MRSEREEIHVYLQLIHFALQQIHNNTAKPLNSKKIKEQMGELRRSSALNLREEENTTRRQQVFAHTSKVGCVSQHGQELHLDICSLCRLSFSSC